MTNYDTLVYCTILLEHSEHTHYLEMSQQVDTTEHWDLKSPIQASLFLKYIFLFVCYYKLGTSCY